jgi:hypothetical protein
MLEYFLANATARKARLFGCGYLRQIWREVEHAEGCCLAVEVAERFADGRATLNELKKAHHFAWEAAESYSCRALGEPVWYAVATAEQDAYDFAILTHYESTEKFSEPDIVNPRTEARLKALKAARHAQWVCLLRELLGNPFRQVSLKSTSLGWSNGTIPKLAQSIYDERAFDRLPILADALEDAGCDNTDILAHCRSGSEHVRGCWVVDLLLGKE